MFYLIIAETYYFIRLAELVAERIDNVHFSHEIVVSVLKCRIRSYLSGGIIGQYFFLYRTEPSCV